MSASELTARAVRLRQLAERTRAVSTQLAAAGTVSWVSLAADGFRERLAREAAQVRRCADAVAEAATAMEVHVRAVSSGTGVGGESR